MPSGGFTYQPKPEFGGVDDVAYTCAALRTLQLLGGVPADGDACRAWLHSLANADGGFGDRPGWRSNPTATYHALAALDSLGALDSLVSVRRAAPRPRLVLPDNLRVFSIQIEAHGTGSPAEVVALADALHIDLWGAKNARPDWLARVRALAVERKSPVRFFRANEEYGTWVDVPGLGTYSHMSDVIGPPNRDIGESLANQGIVTWPEFRQRRLERLNKGGGRLIWQFGENEELVRILLDDSVERDGYAAISTYHFGNPDFTNTEPFLQRWRGQIPFIALQDAHGAEPWWFADQTTGFRMLFLATEPTWEAWLDALRENRVVAVRHDETSRGETWMHASTPEVLEFVRAREDSWRWWDNPAVRRPLVSLVVITPADPFEAGGPEHGVALRVRCAWTNTPQGMPHSPLAEFVRLTLDGAVVATKPLEVKRPTGKGLADTYRIAGFPALPEGRHTAVATVRELATGSIVDQIVEFEV